MLTQHEWRERVLKAVEGKTRKSTAKGAKEVLHLPLLRREAYFQYLFTWEVFIKGILCSRQGRGSCKQIYWVLGTYSLTVGVGRRHRYAETLKE